MKGKAHSEELKQQILKEVEETGNISLVARNHGIAPTTISGWMKNKRAAGTRGPKSSDFNSPNYMKEVEKENDKLKKILGEKDLEIAILKDLLKKTNRL
ncbi:Transposase and inactivated derivatives [Caloramator quimbayensis]|uniref:Transposase and inactivated derivatives n=1 Tax=Caloramator quimbayensis TaxID=1147123 RepID=A0A1T4X4P5_9CLOT|nr:transposase [Caloramator quimbayensis]SKA83801.1 Transposase and inactivated derivatives [Caloramator quimbayensis]